MAMTIEEAGEIVLEGRPWLECTACKGLGRGVTYQVEVFGKDQQGEDAQDYVSLTLRCERCQGYGVTENLEHTFACGFLGMPKAHPPHAQYSATITTAKVWKIETVRFSDGRVWHSADTSPLQVHDEVTLSLRL